MENNDLKWIKEHIGSKVWVSLSLENDLEVTGELIAVGNIGIVVNSDKDENYKFVPWTAIQVLEV